MGPQILWKRNTRKRYLTFLCRLVVAPLSMKPRRNDTTTVGDVIMIEEMEDGVGGIITIEGIELNQNPEILRGGVNFLLILVKYKQFNRNYRVHISEIHTYLDM